MKNLIITTVLAITAISCNKKDDNNTAGTSANNTWTAGSNTYTAATVSRNANTTSLVATDLPVGGVVNQFFISFNAFPGTAGSYDIGAATANSVRAAALINHNGVDKVYVATGSDRLNAVISIRNGKIHAEVPAVWAKQMGGTDSLKISASLTEQ